MSLDDIQLPAIVIQNLYNNALVDLQSIKPLPKTTHDASVQFLGNNSKRVAIIVNNPAAIYLPEDELNFLLGILTACKLSMADVALINLSKNTELHYMTVSEQLHTEKFILFGVESHSLQLPLQFPNYQVQHYNNQVYLSSPPLKKLEDDKTEKTKLWNCLKQVFEIV